MRRPELHFLPDLDFPIEEWRLVEQRANGRFLPRLETLFTVANGYLGLRGNHEEGRPAHEHTTLVAGFHETWPIVHAEDAYGLAEIGQTIINAPDTKTLRVYIDDEPLDLSVAVVRGYERALDFKRGLLTRRLVWETPSGKEVEVRSERLVSVRYRHLAAYSIEVRVLNADAPVVISSQIVNRQDSRAPGDRPGEFDPRKAKTLDHRVLENTLREQDGEHMLLGYRAANSGMTIVVAVDHMIESACPYQVTSSLTADLGKVSYIVEAAAGSPVRVTKLAAYHTSRSVPTAELSDRAGRVLRRARTLGLNGLKEAQREDLASFWSRADVIIEGDPEVQQAVRWNLFQLFQAAVRAEGTGIPAKGLSGLGYEGHYFWDIEIFVLPFLCSVEPRIAKNLLRFRHSMLDKARKRARELNQVGASFPWRTINGDEASAYYQAGTAQYHLNADIAYAIKRYVDITGDDDALVEFGAEVLAETARLWEDLGFYGTDGRFHLHAVTGPDEYTTVVNDNAYTNLMARLNLNYAATVLEWLSDTHPHAFRVLSREIDLREEEIAAWRRAAEAMFVPYDEELGINPQDSEFLEKEPWDFENTPPERYPLLLHYHPLVIYRHQVIKQADVVLAMFLLGNEFTLEQKRRNFALYDPITTSDSSLSPPVHSIIACEVGEHERAMEQFRLALFVDLADVGRNVDHGVHIASTGGTWMALVYGFAGMRDFDGHISFNPALPEEWTRLAFGLQVRGRALHVDLTHERLALRLRHGADLSVGVRGRVVTVTTERVTEVSLI